MSDIENYLMSAGFKYRRQFNNYFVDISEVSNFQTAYFLNASLDRVVDLLAEIKKNDFKA